MYGQAGDLKHIQASQDQVRRINLTMAANCKQYVIGRHEALVRSLATTGGLAEKQWQPKMKS